MANDIIESHSVSLEVTNLKRDHNHVVGAMTPRTRQTFPPVTMGHIREHGCRDLLVSCVSPWCNHSARLTADWLADDTAVRALCPRMVCTRCGLIGADVRPDWSPHTQRPRPAWRALGPPLGGQIC